MKLCNIVYVSEGLFEQIDKDELQKSKRGTGGLASP